MPYIITQSEDDVVLDILQKYKGSVLLFQPGVGEINKSFDNPDEETLALLIILVWHFFLELRVAKYALFRGQGTRTK